MKKSKRQTQISEGLRASWNRRKNGKIHIVQLLCPSRHCIAATAYHNMDRKPAEVEAELKEFVAKFNPWCGICGSKDLRYEDSPTKFKTMKEAMPHLLALQNENLRSRALLELLGETFDSKREKPNGP